METYDLSYIWEKLTDKLSHSISESNMDIYIRQITPVSAENDVICCTVPSTTLCSAIQQNYFSLISALLKDITKNDNIRLELKVKNQIKQIPSLKMMKKVLKATLIQNSVSKLLWSAIQTVLPQRQPRQLPMIREMYIILYSFMVIPALEKPI